MRSPIFKNEQQRGSVLTKVGDPAGEHNICHMWQQQFANLYSSFEYSQDAINSQKMKNAGPNGLFIESLVYGGHRLWIHYSLLFTFFARHCYLPTAFMECEFIPLVKDKCGDITLVSNYMAIAISDVETKLLEFIMLKK